MYSGGVPVPASPLLLVRPTDYQMDNMAPADREGVIYGIRMVRL